MIKEQEYCVYFGANTVPADFKRLEKIAINELRSLMIENVPQKGDFTFESFKQAVIEEINYLNLNDDLINYAESGGYTLGSYKEDASNQNKNKNIISPVAYNILLNCGLLYTGLGGCYND